MYVDRDMKMIVKDESLHNHENEPEPVRNKKLFILLKNIQSAESTFPAKLVAGGINK